MGDDKTYIVEESFEKVEKKFKTFVLYHANSVIDTLVLTILKSFKIEMNMVVNGIGEKQRLIDVKNLVINEQKNGDTANVACCVCGGGCKDDEEWHEAGGEQFDCAWYSTNPERKCLYFGHRNANKGKTANDACCLCKRLFRQRQKA